MSLQTRVRRTPLQPPAGRKTWLRPIGVVLLVVGLIGMGYGFLADLNAQFRGTIAEDSLLADIVVDEWIAQTDSADPEDHWVLIVGKDDSGTVIWEGTEEEWSELHNEATGAYRDDLRTTWLYPSSTVALVGLVFIIVGRSRRAASDGAA